MSIDSDHPSPSADSSGVDAKSNSATPDDEYSFRDTDLTVPAAPREADPFATGETPKHDSKGIVDTIGQQKMLGDFELLREIGRGGMGVVFEARQRSLDKRVAVKVLPFSAVLNPRAIKRFQNEARAAAQLQHRNIIPVYQVGSERGVYFYAMQYIEGGDLRNLFNALQDAVLNGTTSDSVRDAPTPLPLEETKDEGNTPSVEPRTRATPAMGVDGKGSSSHPESTHKSGWSKDDTLASRQLLHLIGKNRSTSIPQFLNAFLRMGIQVADALHYAHEMGIVHRDIKPSNLLLDVDGDVWIADFGLAQIQSDPGMTATGDIVGTLRYMSPEQAHGKRVGVDHRTDIYALGITLYELLTLKPAFSGESRESILRKITFEDPTPPRKIDHRIPVELETIVMKAISKNPADRYQTAAEFADDFRLFQNDQPIKGRKPNLQQRLLRWSRRHRPLVASAAALSAVTFIAAVLIAIISWNYYAATALALDTEREQKAEIEKLLRRSDGLRLAANSSLQLQEDPTRALLLSMEAAQRHPGIDTNDAILQALDAQHEIRTLSGHSGPVGHLAFNADGTKLASAVIQARFNAGPDPALIWDTATGQLSGQLEDEKTITSVAFSPDKFRILTASSPSRRQATNDTEGDSDGQPPTLWDSTKFTKLFSFQDAFLFDAHAAVFDPQGRRAVFPSLGHTATIYDCIAGHDLVKLTGHNKRVVFAAFSPLGDRIATASDDNTVRIWDADSGKQVYEFDLWRKRDPKLEQCAIDSLAFRSDGRQLVTGSNNFGVHLWDLTAGTRINDEHLKGGTATYWPDGMQLLTHLKNGRDMSIRDVTSGTALRSINPDRGGIQKSVISPSGQWIATTGHSDSTLISIWNAAKGEVETELRGHLFIVNDVAFSPDSKLIATASSDRTVKLWHVRNGEDRSTFPTRGWTINAISAASPDGKQFAVVALDPITVGSVVDFADKEQPINFLSQIWTPNWTSTRFAATRGNRLSIHSIANAAELGSIDHANGPFQKAAINLDGDRVAAFGGGEAITLWFPDENRRLSLPAGSTPIHSLKFNPDGDRLVAGSGDGYARVWDANSGQLLASLQNDANVVDVAFRPDGRQFATVTDQNRAILWDSDSFQELNTLQSPEAMFDRIEFNFDGTRIVSFHDHSSNAVHLWNAMSGEFESKTEFTGQVHVALHPTQNEALITSTIEGAAIWQFDQNDLLPVTDTPMIHGAFNSDGSQFVIASAVPFPERPWQAMPAPKSFSPAILERWKRNDLTPMEKVEFTAECIADLQLCRDGKAFVNSGRFFSVINHDVESHESVADIQGHGAQISACLFTSDSKRLITTSWDQTIAIWNSSNGQRLNTFAGHQSAVHCAAISGDDRLLVSGGDDGQCIVWDLMSGEIEHRLKIAQVPIQHVAFPSGDDQILAITSDHSLHLYDLKTEQQVNLQVDAKQIEWAEYSPDGSLLLVIPHASASPPNDDADQQQPAKKLDHRVLIVPLNGDPTTAIVHDRPVITGHFHSNGKQVLTATEKGMVTLRDLPSGTVRQDFSSPDVNVQAAALSASGKYVAVLSSKQVTMWKVDEGLPWMSVPNWHRLSSRWHQFDPFIPGDVKWITQQVKHYRMRDWPIEPLDFATSQSPRTLTVAEKARFLIEQLPGTNE